MKERGIKFFRNIFVGILCLLCVACNETYEGFVYPDRNDLTKSILTGPLETLEACRIMSQSVLIRLDATQTGDYECGKNCDNGSKLGGIKICEETLK